MGEACRFERCEASVTTLPPLPHARDRDFSPIPLDIGKRPPDSVARPQSALGRPLAWVKRMCGAAKLALPRRRGPRTAPPAPLPSERRFPYGAGGPIAEKSKPHFPQIRTPRLTRCPQRGHARLRLRRKIQKPSAKGGPKTISRRRVSNGPTALSRSSRTPHYVARGTPLPPACA